MFRLLSLCLLLFQQLIRRDYIMYICSFSVFTFTLKNVHPDIPFTNTILWSQSQRGRLVCIRTPTSQLLGSPEQP